MRIARFISLLFFILGCSDDDRIVQSGPAVAARRATATPVIEETGVVHEVMMTGTVQTGFFFEPAELTIRVGDTVRWINGTGSPHNVSFYADSIPLGAEVIIDAAMPSEGKLGPMIGRVLSEVGQTFEMDFVNAPVGRYRYYSVVQESMGMLATLVVEQPPVD